MLRDYIQLPLQVRILCLGSLVNRAGSFVLIFLTIYASEEMGFGIFFATACMGVFGLGSMLGSLLGGHLADQIGRRVVMLIALMGGAALLLILSLMQNRLGFITTVGLFALVGDMYRPAASAMIADHVDVDRRPHAFALMYIAINLGFAIAPPIGGILAEYSFQWLFWGDAATMLLYGVIILAFISESIPKPAQAPTSVEPNEPVLRDALQRITGDRTFLLFCLSTLLISLVFMQGMSTLPIHLRQSGFSNLQFGLLMSVNGLLIFLFQLPVTHWLRDRNAMSVIIVGGILIAVGFGLCGLGNGFVFLAMAIAVWTLGEILQAPFKHAVVTDLAPVDLRARYLGMFSMCYALAMTIGAPIGGEVLSRFGPTVLWSGTVVVAMSAVAVYCSIRPAVTRRIAAAGATIELEQPAEQPITVASTQ